MDSSRDLRTFNYSETEGNGMTDNIDNGGPAFPIPGSVDNNCNVTFPEYGMTLRDYFASNAPPAPHGWIGSSDDANTNIASFGSRPDSEIFLMIEWRWYYADAMLTEREKEIS